MSRFRINLLVILIFALHFAPALSDLLISKLDRRVHYRFSNLSFLSEPLILKSGFFSLLFAFTIIVYMYRDFIISKFSPSYLPPRQWDEIVATIQQLHYVSNLCLSILHRLQAALQELSRTGDVQACRAVMKSADSLVKDFNKECKPLLAFLQSFPQAAHIFKESVESSVALERYLQDYAIMHNNGEVL